jgi:hypothetical protein
VDEREHQHAHGEDAADSHVERAEGGGPLEAVGVNKDVGRPRDREPV